MKYPALIAMSSLTFSCVTPNKERLSDGCPGPRKVEAGKTVLLIDVNENGKAENIRVTESTPKGMWDDAAKCIVKKEFLSTTKTGKHRHSKTTK